MSDEKPLKTISVDGTTIQLLCDDMAGGEFSLIVTGKNVENRKNALAQIITAFVQEYDNNAKMSNNRVGGRIDCELRKISFDYISHSLSDLMDRLEELGQNGLNHAVTKIGQRFKINIGNTEDVIEAPDDESEFEIRVDNTSIHVKWDKLEYGGFNVTLSGEDYKTRTTALYHLISDLAGMHDPEARISNYYQEGSLSCELKKMPPEDFIKQLRPLLYDLHAHSGLGFNGAILAVREQHNIRSRPSGLLASSTSSAPAPAVVILNNDELTKAVGVGLTNAHIDPSHIAKLSAAIVESIQQSIRAKSAAVNDMFPVTLNDGELENAIAKPLERAKTPEGLQGTIDAIINEMDRIKERKQRFR